MVKIEQVVVGGPSIVEAQGRLLHLLGKHPDHVFCLSNSDIVDIRAWLTDPDGDEPPPAYDEASTYSVNSIRRALRILRADRKVSSIELNERVYFGTSAAVRRMRQILKKSRGTNHLRPAPALTRDGRQSH
ncbi:MAG: hypothetical protein Q7T05_08045 [Dehalococcoidia bacterium]|nr:hypothetical protein [Dehalococcoidia bacterium]